MTAFPGCFLLLSSNLQTSSSSHLNRWRKVNAGLGYLHTPFSELCYLTFTTNSKLPQVSHNRTHETVLSTIHTLVAPILRFSQPPLVHLTWWLWWNDINAANQTNVISRTGQQVGVCTYLHTYILLCTNVSMYICIDSHAWKLLENILYFTSHFHLKDPSPQSSMVLWWQMCLIWGIRFLSFHSNGKLIKKS